MAGTILIVDDEPNIRRMLGALLRAEGYAVREAPSGQAALLEVNRAEPDAIFLDLMMPPGPDGLATLGSLVERGTTVPVIMMSGQAQLADAVQATRLGAFQFIEKPLTPESVLVTLNAALELQRARATSRALHERLSPPAEMVGQSAAMKAVRALVAQVAPTDARVLVTGESGTGKELVAAAIHRASRRARGPFVAVNCAAIPRDLVESELFGHERGAFTGATERRLGRLELADGGTALLDEVGDLGAEAQAKVLRALESGEIQRVGAETSHRVDVRVIAATNRDLEAAVRQGQFREDLFYRLHVFPIRLPPLRDRLEDLPGLAAHLAGRLRPRQPPAFTASALAALANYRWPGNVRELANVVERLMILGGETIDEADVVGVLPRARLSADHAATPVVDFFPALDERSLPEALDAYERDLIARALDKAQGNVAEAARFLKTDRANLYRRMRRLGIRL